MLRVPSLRRATGGATSSEFIVITGVMLAVILGIVVTFRTEIMTAITSLGCQISSGASGSGGCGGASGNAAGGQAAGGEAPGVRTSGIAAGLVVPPADANAAAGNAGGASSGVAGGTAANSAAGGAAGGGSAGNAAGGGAAGGAAGGVAGGGDAHSVSMGGAAGGGGAAGTAGGAGGNMAGGGGAGSTAGSAAGTLGGGPAGNLAGNAAGGAPGGAAANAPPDFTDARWFQNNPGKVGDYVERPIDGELFVPDRFAVGDDAKRDIRGNDVTQGQLGDCYYLSAMATMAETNPEVIRDAIKDNGNGTYDVTFYDQNQVPATFTVDNTFPVKKSNGRTPFARFSDVSRDNKQETWVIVMEKAWAKFKGSYGSAEGGYGAPAMAALSGKRSTSYSLRPNPTNAPADTVGVLDWKTLETASKKGYAMTVGSVKNNAAQTNPFYQGPNALVAQHEYFISAVDPVKKTVTVRNPWGWQKYERVMTYDEFRQAFEYVGINPGRK